MLDANHFMVFVVKSIRVAVWSSNAVHTPLQTAAGVLQLKLTSFMLERNSVNVAARS